MNSTPNLSLPVKLKRFTEQILCNHPVIEQKLSIHECLFHGAAERLSLKRRPAALIKYILCSDGIGSGGIHQHEIRIIALTDISSLFNLKQRQTDRITASASNPANSSSPASRLE